MEICGHNLQIIYKNCKPYGIRDYTGFLFFFSEVTKYSDQEERYRAELAQQFRLADFLLDALTKACEAPELFPGTLAALDKLGKP